MTTEREAFKAQWKEPLPHGCAGCVANLDSDLCDQITRKADCDPEERLDKVSVIWIDPEVARLQAMNRVAIRNLDKVLNGCRYHDEQQRADTEARGWLASIGGAA